MYYATLMFEQAGFTSSASLLANGIDCKFELVSVQF
jgi:hypothetical protein